MKIIFLLCFITFILTQNICLPDITELELCSIFSSTSSTSCALGTTIK